MILRKDNNNGNRNKIIKTQSKNANDSRNKLFLKKPKNGKNHSSNIYMKTFSNILSASNSFGKAKTISKKNLFLSPFEEGKKRTKIFKILVNFSKEIHSPKHKETNLINNIKIRCFNNRKINKNKGEKKDNDIFLSQKFLLKKFRIKNNLFHESQNEKNESSCNKYENNKINCLLKRLDDSHEIIRNKIIIKNKKKNKA